MATENLTTYTAVDPNLRFTVTADRVTFTALRANEDAYVYYDKGANYFGGSFQALFTLLINATPTNGSYVILFNVANLIDDALGIDTAGGSELYVQIRKINAPAPVLRIELVEVNAGDGYASDDSTGLSYGTPYYIKVVRDEAVGTYGTLYLYVYSDAARTILVQSQSLTLHAKNDFRYIYAIQSFNWAQNSPISGYNENLEITLTSAANPPSVITDTPTSVLDTTATGHGYIDGLGDAPVTQHGSCWSTSANPTTADSKTSQGPAGLGVFASSVTGLITSTLYHIRAYAINAYGTSYGIDMTFTTTITGIPVLSTQSATNVLAATATGRGTIISIGNSAVTQHGVVWDTSVNPTIALATKTTDGAATAGSFTSSITGLTAGMLYYYRAYATNTQGTGYGNNEIVVFQTSPYVVLAPTTGGLASAADPLFTSSPSFVDIWPDIISLNIKRGRMHELDRIEAGTAVVTLKNTSGNYWRNNSSGTFYPNLGPLMRVSFPITYGTTTYQLFDGVTESFQPGWVESRGGNAPIMTIQCVDMFKTFTRYPLVGTSTGAVLYNSELSGTRVNNVLNTVGWPAVARAIDTGQVTIAALVPPVGGENAMEHLQDVIAAENGVFFMRGDGYVVFQDRDARQKSPYDTSQATFASSSMLYVRPELIDDDTYIYNEARIQPNPSTGAGAEQVYLSSTAQATQGLRAWVSTDSIMQYEGDAFNKAYLIVSRYSSSAMRCQSLEILPDASPSTLYPKVFGYDISTRITLQLNNTTNPANLNKQYHIEGVELNYDARTNLWDNKWQLWDVNQYQLFKANHYGYIIKQDATYLTAHNTTAGAPPYNDQSAVEIGQTSIGGLYRISRGLVTWDTSTLSTGMTITTGDIVIVAPTTSNISSSFNMVITGRENIVYPLSASDYGGMLGLTSTYGIATVSTGNFVSGSYLVIPLNALGISALVAEGTTGFVFRTSDDISSIAPTGSSRLLFNSTASLILKIAIS